MARALRASLHPFAIRAGEAYKAVLYQFSSNEFVVRLNLADEFIGLREVKAGNLQKRLPARPPEAICTSARPTAWLGISDSNSDVQRENSSL
jgi:hypothetical protein